MFNRFFTLAAMTIATVGAIAPIQAQAGELLIPGTTNDGDRFSIQDNIQFPQQNGWTIFQYRIYRADGTSDERNATTPYCYRGQVRKHPRAINHFVLPSLGWFAIVDNSIVVVLADSSASQNLMRAVCRQAP